MASRCIRGAGSAGRPGGCGRRAGLHPAGDGRRHGGTAVYPGRNPVVHRAGRPGLGVRHQPGRDRRAALQLVGEYGHLLLRLSVQGGGVAGRGRHRAARGHDRQRPGSGAHHRPPAHHCLHRGPVQHQRNRPSILLRRRRERLQSGRRHPGRRFVHRGDLALGRGARPGRVSACPCHLRHTGELHPQRERPVPALPRLLPRLDARGPHDAPPVLGDRPRARSRCPCNGPIFSSCTCRCRRCGRWPLAVFLACLVLCALVGLSLLRDTKDKAKKSALRRAMRRCSSR